MPKPRTDRWSSETLTIALDVVYNEVCIWLAVIILNMQVQDCGFYFSKLLTLSVCEARDEGYGSLSVYLCVCVSVC